MCVYRISAFECLDLRWRGKSTNAMTITNKRKFNFNFNKKISTIKRLLLELRNAYYVTITSCAAIGMILF